VKRKQQTSDIPQNETDLEPITDCSVDTQVKIHQWPQCPDDVSRRNNHEV